MGDKNDLIVRDWLAIDRTNLANERTFLAYFRTFVVILSSAVAILKVEVLSELEGLGIFLLILSPIILAVGLFRFFYVRRKVKKYFREN